MLSWVSTRGCVVITRDPSMGIRMTELFLAVLLEHHGDGVNEHR